MRSASRFGFLFFDTSQAKEKKKKVLSKKESMHLPQTEMNRRKLFARRRRRICTEEECFRTTV